MKRKLIIILIYITVPICMAIATFKGLKFFFLAPLDPSNQNVAVFEVAADKSFRQVAGDLERQGFIRHNLCILLLAKYQKKDTLVMAGEYEISPSMGPQQILDAMVEGKMILRKVTVKEGATIKEIGPLLEEAGIVSKDLFEAALQDPKLREELKVPASSFEGYLFPETYRIQRNTSPKKVIQKFRAQLDTVWSDLWNLRLIELQMTRHQILTLASIIEKESGNSEEQPLVSSVFHNRLKRGMRLQSDPTVIYGIPNFNGNLTKSDLSKPTLYNTYVIAGLPPGPIANPGTSAIKAALYPASSNFLYFVGNGQGKHVFSETLDQHNRAVNTFQRGEGPSPVASPSATPTAQPPQQSPIPTTAALP